MTLAHPGTQYNFLEPTTGVVLGFKDIIQQKHLFQAVEFAHNKLYRRYTLILDQALCNWLKSVHLNTLICKLDSKLKFLNGPSRLQKGFTASDTWSDGS
jgi:hypothetical protein